MCEKVDVKDFPSLQNYLVGLGYPQDLQALSAPGGAAVRELHPGAAVVLALAGTSHEHASALQAEVRSLRATADAERLAFSAALSALEAAAAEQSVCDTRAAEAELL